MIAAWMVYSLLVGALLYAAARAAELVCRALGVPTRFAWALALYATLGLSGNALRSAARPATTKAASRRSVTPGATGNWTSPSVIATTAPVALPRWHGAQVLQDAAERAANVLDPNAWTGATRLDRGLGIGALLSGSAAICCLVAMMGRLRRIARACEEQELDGCRILISHDIGPALIGIVRPRIIVPRWTLSLSVADLRGILAHEREHASAGDPVLVSLAALGIALSPWNLGVWGIFQRLRLAIEADCDARVLRIHGDVRRYGALLLTVYERTIASRTPRLAFVERRSHLEERIRRLKRHRLRLSSTRGVAALMASVLLTAAACETTVPSRAAHDSAMQRVASRSGHQSSVVGVEPPCLGPSGSRHPSMEELIARSRPRHPEIFEREHPPLALGLLLDENCAIRRDTVIERDARGGGEALLAAAFGDTTGFRFWAVGWFPARAYGGPLSVAWAVKASEPWRERLSHDACGFGVRSDEYCSSQGALEFRMLDSVRALIAMRRFRAANQPVDQLFLVTLARPTTGLRSLSMIHAVVSFQSGAVYVEDFQATQPLWLFAPSTSNGLANLKHKRDVHIFDDLVGVAHYTGVQLTLEQIRQLTPARSCEGPKGSCYEVKGQTIRFPA
jgi:beta-lactamase regulating signal transducer with metallopeptidase domain